MLERRKDLKEAGNTHERVYAEAAVKGSSDRTLGFGSALPVALWVRMNNGSWAGLHGISPEDVVNCDMDGNGQDDVIIDFGSALPVPLWVRMNNSSWVGLHGVSPESMVCGDMDGNGKDDVIVDFGAALPVSLWVQMNNSSWVGLHGISPEDMVVGDSTAHRVSSRVVKAVPPIYSIRRGWRDEEIDRLHAPDVFFRNVRHVCDGGFGWRVRHFDTAASETSKPGFGNSP